MFDLIFYSGGLTFPFIQLGALLTLPSTRETRSPPQTLTLTSEVSPSSNQPGLGSLRARVCWVGSLLTLGELPQDAPVRGGARRGRDHCKGQSLDETKTGLQSPRPTGFNLCGPVRSFESLHPLVA